MRNKETLSSRKEPYDDAGKRAPGTAHTISDGLRGPREKPYDDAWDWAPGTAHTISDGLRGPPPPGLEKFPEEARILTEGQREDEKPQPIDGGRRRTKNKIRKILESKN